MSQMVLGTQKLVAFVSKRFDKDDWEQFFVALELTAILKAQGTATDQYVEETLAMEMKKLLKGLTDDELKYFKNLLERDSDMKQILIEGIDKTLGVL